MLDHLKGARPEPTEAEDRKRDAAKDDILEALKAGVNDYVIKPFTPDVIKAKVTAVMSK